MAGAQPEGVAFDAAGNLYVSDYTNSKIFIFNPPFTNASTPATTISGGTSGLAHPSALTFDSAGNLYAANEAGPTVTVYSPPFVASSTPVTTITTAAGSEPFAITWGP
jgi:sugar lactone lactonase YvrE